MSTYIQNPDVPWSDFLGGVLAVTARDSTLHELNSTGSFLWRSLAEERSLEELARSLSSEFEVSYEQAFRDVEEFVSRLLSQKLLLSRE